MKMPGKMYRTKIPDRKLGKMVNTTIGRHDLVRRTDKHGEALMWCRKCSRYARQRMGPKLMNCTKNGKMLKIIQTLEDGRVPAK